MEELKERVCGALRAELPNITVKISQLSENMGDLGVSVYGVERKQVRLAKDIILNLDGELCGENAVSLTPMVRDMETTRQHYPQFLPSWTSEMVPGTCGTADLIPVALVESIEVNQSEWVEADASILYAGAANEELALAA